MSIASNRFISIITIAAIFILFIAPSLVVAQEDCAGEARSMRYEVYDAYSKCTRECGDTYYYDKEGRASCWRGCDAVWDAKLGQADVWLDACLAGLRDAGKDQSPQPTEDVQPEEIINKESEQSVPDASTDSASKPIDKPTPLSGVAEDLGIDISNPLDLWLTLVNAVGGIFDFQNFLTATLFAPEQTEYEMYDKPWDDYFANLKENDPRLRQESLLLDTIAAIPELPTDGSDFTFRVDISQGRQHLTQTTQEIVNPEQGAIVIRDSYQISYGHADSVVKLPGSSDWVPLNQGMELPVGTEIFTGMDTTTVFSIPGLGTVEVAPFTNLVLNKGEVEQGVEEGLIYNDFDLRVGEIEVDIEGGDYQAAMQVHTPNVVAGVRGTHFWVSYSPDGKYSLVGVYKGEVEVKDSATAELYSVKPEGNKPGILVIPEKNTITSSIILAGLIAVVMGGIVWFIKKKTSIKSSKKR